MGGHEHIVQESGYKNPLTRDFATADPCIVYSKKHGCYYGTYPGNTTITLHRAKKLGDMFSRSESTVVYTADPSDDTYGYPWAPELHCINGKWYMSHRRRDGGSLTGIFITETPQKDELPLGESLLTDRQT